MGSPQWSRMRQFAFGNAHHSLSSLWPHCLLKLTSAASVYHPSATFCTASQSPWQQHIDPEKNRHPLPLAIGSAALQSNYAGIMTMDNLAIKMVLSPSFHESNLFNLWWDTPVRSEVTVYSPEWKSYSTHTLLLPFASKCCDGVILSAFFLMLLHVLALQLQPCAV